MKEGMTPSKIDRFLEKISPHPIVALVDDDPVTMESLERTLRDEGYEIYRFSRAEDLLKQFNEIKPDVIVMEAILPGMNGLSALDELRPKSPEEIIPVLILSKKDDLRAKLLAYRRGASDYVTKPFDAEEIAARVRTLIRTKMLQKMLQTSGTADPLTAVYNRRFLSIWLAREIERVKRYGLELSCLLMDLENLPVINEKMGESFGDFIVRELATVVAENTRASDIVGRLESGKFLILLPGTSKEAAMVVARRLRQVAGERNFEQGSKKALPTFSIGIVGCDAKETPHPNTLLEKAEEALAQAKAVGSGETAVLGIH